MERGLRDDERSLIDGVPLPLGSYETWLYLSAMLIQCGKTKLTAIVLPHLAAVVFIELVFELIDLSNGEVVPGKDAHLRRHRARRIPGAAHGTVRQSPTRLAGRPMVG
jgi:hypothetical protein